MPEKPLRQRIHVMLIALLADIERSDMNDHRLLVELIDNAIELPNCTDGIITGEFVNKWFAALLRFLPEIVYARSDCFTYPHVSNRAKMCPRFGCKDDLPRWTHRSSSALTVSQSSVSPRATSCTLWRKAAICSGSPRISSVSVIDS